VSLFFDHSVRAGAEPGGGLLVAVCFVCPRRKRYSEPHAGAHAGANRENESDVGEGTRKDRKEAT
jgi:hypothetical protein